MKKIDARLLVIIAAMVLVAGCSAISKYVGDGGAGADAYSAPRPVMAAPAPFKGSAAAMPYTSDRKIIRTIYLSIEVGDIAVASETILKIAGELGGFVADSRSYEDDSGRRMMSLKIRVPADSLDAAVGRIRPIGHIGEENISGDDVTEEYVDLEARLKNAKILEERILKLLEQKSARLKDILDSERELSAAREKIESLEGRKKFMDDRLQLATISIDLAEPPGFGRGIFDPLRGLFQRTIGMFTASLALLVVVTCAAVPWIVTIIILAWLFLQLLRLWVRRRREIRAQRQQRANNG